MDTEQSKEVEFIETEDYKSFTEKFKHKKNTDDCYTPPAVYDTVVEWVLEEFPHLKGKRFVRPFFPGGDYENYPYEGNDVVVDNPPFSISKNITVFYEEHGIPFFMFAHHLTLFSLVKDRPLTAVVAGVTVTYENGAKVLTSFVTNLYGGRLRIVGSGKLHDALKKAQAEEKKGGKAERHFKFVHPKEYITVSKISQIACRGIDIRIPADGVRYEGFLRNPDGTPQRMFGGGFVACRAEAARAEAARAEAARAEAARAEAARAEAARASVILGLPEEQQEYASS